MQRPSVALPQDIFFLKFTAIKTKNLFLPFSTQKIFVAAHWQKFGCSIIYPLAFMAFGSQVKCLIELASAVYFKIVETKLLDAKITISPI